MANKIVVTKFNTVIMGGVGDPESVKARTDSIRAQISEADEKDPAADKLRERLARLTSGIGIISVGATTDAERKELRDRVDDAFCAAKAAAQHGIVPGGGVALLKTRRHLESWRETLNITQDEMVGVKIFCDSLAAPCRKILENAGIDASLVVETILKNDNSANYGYNVLRREYVDMVQDGIIDPTEVVLNEIKNASSVASLLLVTEALIVDEPQQKNV